VSKIRGRLAPSPTGVLHLGNARSFLLAWLDIRARGGEIILRIEDLDGPRIKTGAAQAAIEDLQWLGLDWDEGPFTQRDNTAVYQAALEDLKNTSQVYPCKCSRKDVEQAASAPHETLDGLIYPQTCKHQQVDISQEHCWRFALDRQACNFVDGFVGKCNYQPDRQLGDFVVWKRDNEPAYQLAVVVDDFRQGVTEVLRGADLLPSTARQIALYRALGWPIPQFTHVPLVVGEDGRRLAKRHGDTTIANFREQGISANQLVGMLAHWCGLNAQCHPVTPQQLISDFSLAQLPVEPAVWSGQVR